MGKKKTLGGGFGRDLHGSKSEQVPLPAARPVEPASAPEAEDVSEFVPFRGPNEMPDFGADEEPEPEPIVSIGHAATLSTPTPSEPVLPPPPKAPEHLPTLEAPKAATPAPAEIAKNTKEREFFKAADQRVSEAAEADRKVETPKNDEAFPRRTRPVRRVVAERVELPAATPRRLFWHEYRGVILLGAICTALALFAAWCVVMGLNRFFDAETPHPEPATAPTLPAPAPAIPVGVEPPPPPAPSAPTAPATEPGVNGASGTFVRVPARIAFPRTCATALGERRTDGVVFVCGLGQRRGSNLCACDATRRIP